MFCIVLFQCITSCGYQLQKPLLIEDHLQPIYVSGNLLLSNALTRKLREQSIVIANNAANARSFMRIELIDASTRELSISHDGRTAENSRNLLAQLEWRSSEKQLLDTIISANANQSSNPENQAAQQAEAELIAGELQQKLIATAMQRIRHTLANSDRQAGLNP